MAKIKSKKTKQKRYSLIPYEKKGKTAWRFDMYVGFNPVTGKNDKRLKGSGFETEKEALEALLAAQEEWENYANTRKDPSSMLFEEVSREFLSVTEGQVKQSTINFYERMLLNYIHPIFGEKRLNEIELQLCKDAVSKWEREVNGTAKVLKNLTSRILQFAVKNEYLNQNKMGLIDVPKRDPKKVHEKVYLTKEELNGFLNEIEKLKNRQYYIFFYLLAHSGLRRSELLGCRFGDFEIAPNNQYMIVSIKRTVQMDNKHQAYFEEPKTRASKRNVQLSKKCVEILLEWKQIRMDICESKGYAFSDETLLFATSDNKVYRPGVPNYWLKWCFKKITVSKQFTPHDLRRTHCALCFQAGLSVDVVQRRLGHEKYQTTMDIYNFVMPQRAAEGSDIFAKFMDDL
jgi:integrase